MEAAPAQGTNARYVTPVHRGTEGGHVFPQVDRRRFLARKLWNIDGKRSNSDRFGKKRRVDSKTESGD